MTDRRVASRSDKIETAPYTTSGRMPAAARRTTKRDVMRLNLPLSGRVPAAANQRMDGKISRVRRRDHLESIAHRTGYLPKRQEDGRRVIQGLLLNPSERALVLRIVGGAPQIVECLIQTADFGTPTYFACSETTRM